MSSLIQCSIELTPISIQTMHQGILQEFVDHLKDAVFKAIPNIKAKTISIVEQALRYSDVWSAINGGDLGAMLLLPNPASSLYQIERSIIESIVVSTNPIGISGSFIT